MFKKLNAVQSKQIRTIIIIHDHSVVRSIWHQKQLCFIEHDRRFWNFDVFTCASRLYKIDASIINYQLFYQFNCSNYLIFKISMCLDHYNRIHKRKHIFENNIISRLFFWRHFDWLRYWVDNWIRHCEKNTTFTHRRSDWIDVAWDWRQQKKN